MWTMLHILDKHNMMPRLCHPSTHRGLAATLGDPLIKLGESTCAVLCKMTSCSKKTQATDGKRSVPAVTVSPLVTYSEHTRTSSESRSVVPARGTTVVIFHGHALFNTPNLKMYTTFIFPGFAVIISLIIMSLLYR